MSEYEFKEKLDTLSGDFAVIDDTVYKLYGERLAFKHKLVLRASERNKSLETVGKICDFLLENGADRYSCVTAVGGGVILDITGFAAAIYMRGIEWESVPTTLLAQADAAVGGKTGVNFKAKNILGAFHSPRRIIFITEFLRSSDKRAILCGLGEILKTSLLNNEIFTFVRNNKESLKSGDVKMLAKAAKMCALEKSRICETDFSDKDIRHCLNMGHTVGHAIESCTELTHGESVLFGLKIECEMFNDIIEPAFFKEILGLIDFFTDGKPLPHTNRAELFDKLSKDKKNHNGIVFEIPCAIGKTKRITLQAEEAKDKLYEYFTS